MVYHLKKNHRSPGPESLLAEEDKRKKTEKRSRESLVGFRYNIYIN